MLSDYVKSETYHFVGWRLCTKRAAKIEKGRLGKGSQKAEGGNGAHITRNYARRRFERILDKAGLRKIRFHGICHSYASLMGSKGGNLKYVSQQMGHSSIDITLDCYSRFIPQGGRSEVNLLESDRETSASYVRVGPGETHKMGNGGDAGIRTPDAADMSRML